MTLIFFPRTVLVTRGIAPISSICCAAKVSCALARASSTALVVEGLDTPPSLTIRTPPLLVLRSAFTATRLGLGATLRLLFFAIISYFHFRCYQ